MFDIADVAYLPLLKDITLIRYGTGKNEKIIDFG
jgi:hypothetical protein